MTTSADLRCCCFTVWRLNIIMADQAVDDDNEIFIYTGGRAPQHVINVIIDKSVKEIDRQAFYNNRNLRSVECHAGVERIGRHAFCSCPLLRQIKLTGVKLIEQGAFSNCRGLEDVEFGDKLETVEKWAFDTCEKLKSILTMPSVRTIGNFAFSECTGLTEAEFGEGLEEIGAFAFNGCSCLRRIAVPLKDNIIIPNIDSQTYAHFDYCANLSTVDLVSGIHETVASLQLENWRNEMNGEIQRINRVLPGTGPTEKTDTIRQWIRSVIIRIDHYKAEHLALLKEATTLLELALWKANLNKDEDDYSPDAEANIDVDTARKEKRITAGADVIIKNVLPFLQLQ